jgi:hypothetical protein
MMKFDSAEYLDTEKGECYFGAVRAVVDEQGSGNSEVTVLEFETPSGFAQLMEVEVMTGDMPQNRNKYTLEDVHTIRIKIVGEWEGSGIKHGLADLVHALKLKATFEKGEQ